jgi:hypothetical protein
MALYLILAPTSDTGGALVGVRDFLDWVPSFVDWCQDEWIQSTKPRTLRTVKPLLAY